MNRNNDHCPYVAYLVYDGTSLRGLDKERGVTNSFCWSKLVGMDVWGGGNMQLFSRLQI